MHAVGDEGRGGGRDVDRHGDTDRGKAAGMYGHLRRIFVPHDRKALDDCDHVPG